MKNLTDHTPKLTNSQVFKTKLSQLIKIFNLIKNGQTRSCWSIYKIGKEMNVVFKRRTIYIYIYMPVGLYVYAETTSIH